MNPPEPPDTRPYWLWQTKRLFPHPIFAGCVSLAFLAVGILFAGVAFNVAGCWAMGIPSMLFFAGCFATAAAAVTPYSKAQRPEDGHVQKNKPTFAILVLLIGVYSWLLTVALTIYITVFEHGPVSMKYFVTLAIAMISSLYMRLYGGRVVREHFGARGGHNLELTGRQAFIVVVLVLFVGFYGAWIAM